MKRKSYTRHIPLNKEAFQTLSAWRAMRSADDKLVFPSKNGQKMDNIQTSWEKVRKDSGIVNLRWHDVRHHFASRLVMNGVPLNTVRLPPNFKFPPLLGISGSQTSLKKT